MSIYFIISFVVVSYAVSVLLHAVLQFLCLFCLELLSDLYFYCCYIFMHFISSYAGNTAERKSGFLIVL